METRDQQQQRRPLTEEEKRRRAARQKRLAEERAAAEKAEKKRRRLIRTLLITAVLLSLATAAGLWGYRYYSKLRNDTASFFEKPQAAATATPAAAAATPAQGEAAEAPTAPSSEYDTLMQQADTSMMQNIVNVLLIGVDYAEERLTEEWLEEGGSTAEHADVMIVLAINFDEQTVDMISLPRDTYAKIPGVTGIYKLNASLDCGGGLFLRDASGQWLKDENGNYVANDAGFDKVREACSWMLGGIPIDYYYAVTMPAVKELVNAIGGVDYDLDVSFSMQGREYTAGQQHMDGQAVLDYLRVRKASSGLGAGETGDGSRVNRQKDMLVAILNQLRDRNMLLKVPDILKSFEGQLFTNCSFEQTAALALYAYDMPSANIRMCSMDGIWSSKKSAKLNFCFTDQEKRVSIIRDVYGIEVPEMRDCTMAYAYWFWNDLVAERYLSTCHALKEHVGDDGSSFVSDYNEVRSLKSSAAKAAATYLAGDSDYLTAVVEELEAALESLRHSAMSAKNSSGYSRSLDFYSTLERYNEIDVDPS